MNFSTAFGIDPDVPELVCLVGGGGKTTTIFRLARELKQHGKRVLVTTTTNMFLPGEDQCDALVLTALQDERLLGVCPPGAVLCLGGGVITDKLKLKSVDPAYLDRLFQAGLFDAILVEADGAKRKPIKAAAEYEPVFPVTATLTIGCVGLDAVGRTVDEACVHRVEHFCRVTGANAGENISAQMVARLISSPKGLFKGVPLGSRRHVLLNKADDEQRRSAAAAVIDELRQPGDYAGSITVASAAEGTVYRRHPKQG